MNDLVEGCKITGNVLLDGEDIYCLLYTSVRYLEEFSLTFDAAILSAPMLGMNTGKYPKWLAKVTADFFCALLSRFVGMLTDSRSFLSYPRHEYFRRILCNMLGNEIEKGLLPASELSFIGQMAEDISYNNAKRYFDF